MELDFETVRDDQKQADFAIYEGENVMCSNNTEIGTCRMEEGAIKEGSQRLVCKFELNRGFQLNDSAWNKDVREEKGTKAVRETSLRVLVPGISA